MSKGGDKSLWDIAIEESSETGNQHQCDESSILFVGSKSSGKTSIILRFLDRDEVAKPTTALEYTYGRRAKGHNIAKDIAHIWELGGGTWLSRLMDAPISIDSILSTSLVIVLDLSLPNELWFTLETLLNAAKARINEVIAAAKSSHPDLKEKLKQKAWERLGDDIVDKDMMEPLLIPLIIIGSKYDLFQEFDSEKRKVISRTLRFMAHLHGGTLMYFSNRQESLMMKTRAIISSHVFGTAPAKNIQADHNKPIIVPAGFDALQQIGSPPLPDGDIGKITARSPVELWKQAYTAYFPQETLNDPSMVEDPCKDIQFAEPAIDAMRAQKNEELERYRRVCERKMQEAQQRAMMEGMA